MTIKKSVKEKEDKLLDMYPEEIIGDSERVIKKRRQARAGDSIMVHRTG